MERHCLFIDDDIEEFESVIQRLPGIAKQSLGLEVTYDMLDPTDIKYRSVNDNIDLTKIEEDFAERISKQKYDLVACDYNLSDDVFFGTDIIKRYRTRDQKFIAVIYSANLKEIAKNIIGLHNPDEMDTTLNKITGLVTSKISRFFNKTNQLMNDLAPMLYEVTAEKHIEQTLIKYKQLQLVHGLASFVDTSLEEIASHVRNDTDQGKKFVEEVIERGISHFIDLSK